jgi:cell shape-determining protein MreC
VLPSRFKALLLLVFLFLAALSLQRKSELAEELDALCEPARNLRVLAAPIAWLSTGPVRAAEQGLLAGEEARRAAGRAVLAAAQTSAAPSERALAEGRGLVHAEVVERPEEDKDRLIVRFAPEADVQPGMPVVSGDFYVGRVAFVDTLHRGEARVDLVTRKDFRVGAVAACAAGDPVRLVVGGLLPKNGKDEDLLLAAHCPSDPTATAGEVRVREAGSGSDVALQSLADGFLLGALERVRRGEALLLCVRPGLDYHTGPAHIGILCPSQHAPAGPDLARDPFEDERWMDAHFSLAGDSSFWRETRVVSAGSSSGITDGAALAFGSSLLGCVEHPGARTSVVRLLGDPGLKIQALAAVVDISAGSRVLATIQLGLLVSLGRDRSDGALLLRWTPSIRTDEFRSDTAHPAGGVEVVLYTASGHRSMPPGLLLGRTTLPPGRGPFVLRIRQEESGLALTRARVWREEAPIAVAAPVASSGGRGP